MCQLLSVTYPSFHCIDCSFLDKYKSLNLSYVSHPLTFPLSIYIYIYIWVYIN